MIRRSISAAEAGMLATLVETGDLRAKVTRVLHAMDARCDWQPYQVRVVYGARTAEQQDALYAQGRGATGPIVTYAKAGQSPHCYAAAADIALVADDRSGWLAGNHRAWLELAAIVRGEGLTTGSDFMRWDPSTRTRKPMPDRAHMELTDWAARVRMGEITLWHGAPATGAKAGKP